MRTYDLTQQPPKPLRQPPELSAAKLLSRGQTRVLVALLSVAAALVLMQVLFNWGPPLYVDVMVVFDAILILTAATVVFKGIGFIYSLGPGGIKISDHQARSVPKGGYPKAVLLLPTYGEPHMIPRIVEAVRALEYPADRLLILFAIEWKDHNTLAALEDELLSDQYGVVICPKRDKPGKPDACNYALQIAVREGWCDEDSIAGIFDIEDVPEPLQVARAAWALLGAPRRVGAVQARLNFTDPDGLNWLGRQDQAAYDWNFTLWNRGLEKMGGPFPLGGTSQWFRMRILYDRLAGWDPDNLTEDADIGIKLARHGFDVRTFNSHTDELANRQLRNWLGRDARWWAGFVQTYLVHMRHPWRLLLDLGPSRFISFQLNLGFMPLTQVVNPLFWILTFIYILARAEHWVGIVNNIEGLFPAPIYLIGIVAFALGNALMVFFLVAAAHETRHYRGLVGVVFTAPVYWVLLFAAAVRGMPMLITKKWFRTGHGGGEANAGDKLPDVPTMAEQPLVTLESRD
jgi:cellulose synthase/poly-beta-1,6-N-acetylglucosamine synthase-like glycosyltransferase